MAFFIWLIFLCDLNWLQPVSAGRSAYTGESEICAPLVTRALRFSQGFTM